MVIDMVIGISSDGSAMTGGNPGIFGSSDSLGGGA